MTRSLAVRGASALVACVGVACLFGLFSLLPAAGCTATDIGSDLGIVESGCRAPSACYKLGTDCGCARADVLSATPSCRTCDPRIEPCTCSSANQCLSEANVCVGRQALRCEGVGARCLPAGQSCASAGGVPPNQVGSGTSATLEPHCAYTDDVCCPGAVNGDGGATD